jgi:hypothetical protein
LLFPLVSSLEFVVSGNVKQGETIITKLSGNILTPVTKENVFFYRYDAGIPVKIPVEYDIKKINEDYYLYAFLSGKSPGNYSVYIKNVKYMEGASVSEEDIIRNFTIINETADFSLKPGFVVTAENFYLEVQNLKDSQISIDIKTNVNATPAARDILISSLQSKEASMQLKSGEIKKINFELGYGQPTFQFIELKTSDLSYKVPVYIFSGLEETEEALFRIEPSELISAIPTNAITKKTVYLYNTGSEEIRNIRLSFSDSISAFANLSQYKIDKLEANSNAPIELSFFSPGETEVSGVLKANTGSIIAYTQISLKFLDDYIPSNETGQFASAKTCAELHGVVCSQDEKCDKEIIYAKDNVCCPGTCISTAAANPLTGKVIGIALIVVVVAFLVWFYFKKYRKARKPLDLLKIGKKD